jgi:hypothetical protein
MDVNDINDNEASFVAAQGCTLNVHGSVYERGKAFSHSRKVEIDDSEKDPEGNG